MNYGYMDEGLHTHAFSLATTCDDRHRHCIRGETESSPDTRCHVHSFQGRTTCDCGHLHYFCGVTGPAIPAPSGHIHQIKGETTYDCGHNHAFKGRTSRGQELPCPETPCPRY